VSPPGKDTLTSLLRGNQGDDTLQSANGYADDDYCAAGVDTVTADAMEPVGSDCENVTITPGRPSLLLPLRPR
jgi:hypothetical protein